MIFKFLPDARLSWRDVRLGAALTAAYFWSANTPLAVPGQRRSGIRLRSGRVADHDVIWIYYAAQIVLFGAEFTESTPRNAAAAFVRQSMPCASIERKSSYQR